MPCPVMSKSPLIRVRSVHYAPASPLLRKVFKRRRIIPINLTFRGKYMKGILRWLQTRERGDFKALITSKLIIIIKLNFQTKCSTIPIMF